MNENHTPAPWSMQPIGDETECNILGAGRELIATVSDNDAPIIAAAPDLLAALERVAHVPCEQLRGAHCTMIAPYTGKWCPWCQARAAIAKARGE